MKMSRPYITLKGWSRFYNLLILLSRLRHSKSTGSCRRNRFCFAFQIKQAFEAMGEAVPQHSRYQNVEVINEGSLYDVKYTFSTHCIRFYLHVLQRRETEAVTGQGAGNRMRSIAPVFKCLSRPLVEFAFVTLARNSAPPFFVNTLNSPKQ